MSPERSSNLNRSFSAPDVSLSDLAVCRRVVVEEFFCVPITAGRFSRRLSYDQDLGHPAGSVQSSSLQDINNLASPEVKREVSHFYLMHPRKMVKPNKSGQLPMDVDMEEVTPQTSHEPKVPNVPKPNILDECDIHYRGRVPILTKKIKKKKKPKIEKDVPSILDDHEIESSTKSALKEMIECEEVATPTKKKRRWFVPSILLGVLISMYAVSIYENHYYNHTINVNDIETNLTKHVIHQNVQISQIIKSVHYLNDQKGEPSMQVLLFIGTTGVGKTYCVNFVKRAFKSKQIHEINLDQHDFDSVPDFSRKVPYLVVVDNLKMSDTGRVLEILEKFPPDSKILTILVFNIQDTQNHIDYTVHREQIVEIPKAFEGKRFWVEVVVFNSFDKAIIRVYRSLIKAAGKAVHEGKFLDLLDEHNFDHFGFKGFYAKLDLL